ncbi:MAG: hypothetical protein E7372_03755 [Clostridiales bacterium]|nr:hypothetical protein [Clostridiales bacterium]
MKKKGIKTLLASLVAIVISFTMLLGTTFAWFTDSSVSSNNIIASGTLDVNAYWMEGSNDPSVDTNWIEFNGDPIFNYSNWEPGYVEAKHIKIANEGTLAFKYKIIISPNGPVSKLADVIDVYFLNEAQTITSESITSATNVGTLADLIADPDGAAYGVLLPSSTTIPINSNNEAVGSIAVSIAFKMPENVGNEYNNLSIGTDFNISVYATQYDFEEDTFGNDYDQNAEYPALPEKWDGTADTSWYDPSNPQTHYDIGTAEQLAGLSELVSGDVTFKDVTFTLTNDIDLYCEDTTPSADGDPLTFRPIGDKSKDGTFEGVFDGNGKVISNLYQNGWDLGYEWGAYGSYGLFGNVNNATIKNLTIKGAESYIEGGDVGGITGSASGTCVFENITLEDSQFATYNNGNGGIIGWSGAGDYTFKNIEIKSDVVLAGLWGSFDSSVGGVVGQAEPGATYNFENVNIACRLDVYNDCTASYDYYNYRMCGMLIGRCAKTTTIDGTNYPDMTQYEVTCNNVTVTYGEWANYHYCEPTPGLNNGRGMRVEAGYSYDGLPADYDHSQCVDNHMLLIPFDQIIGGDQIAVKGLKSYEGVTVIYNNK